MDKSEEDYKYFTENKTYNCPYCKRKNVKYDVTKRFVVDWSNSKKAYGHLVRCSESDCKKVSLHFSNHFLDIPFGQFSYPSKEFALDQRPKAKSISGFGAPSFPSDTSGYLLREDALSIEKYSSVDSYFFFHHPTSFFILDSRIPKEIREPLSEAEKCLESGFITGASACLRKAIFKILKKEGISEKNEGDSTYLKYEKRLELLQDKHPRLDTLYLESLKGVYTVTSKEVHENDWKDLKAKDLRFLIEITKTVIIEIYVSEAEKNKKRERLLALKK